MNFLLSKAEPITKTSIAEAVQKVEKIFDSGDVEILEGLIQLKAINEVSGTLLKNLSETGIKERAKYPEKEASILSVSVSLVQPTKPKLNFEEDEQFNELTQMLKQRKSELEDAFKLHQTGKTIVDNSGEIVPVISVKSYGAEYLKYSFKK